MYAAALGKMAAGRHKSERSPEISLWWCSFDFCSNTIKYCQF